jgi:hypothetical protein
MSTYTWLRPSSSHNHSLQEHLYILRITASTLIWWRPLSLHDHGIQVYPQTRTNPASRFARWGLHSVCPNWLDHHLGVYLYDYSVTGCKCISNEARLLPPSASPNSLYPGSGVYLWVHSIIVFRHTLNCYQVPAAASPDILCAAG